MLLAVGAQKYVAFAVGMPGANRSVCPVAFGPFAGPDWKRTSHPDCYDGWIMLAGPKAIPGEGCPDPRYWDVKCEAATNAARAARFEFGEVPV